MGSRSRVRARQMLNGIKQHANARSARGISVAQQPHHCTKTQSPRTPKIPDDAGSTDGAIGPYPYQIVDDRGGEGMITLGKA